MIRAVALLPLLAIVGLLGLAPGRSGAEPRLTGGHPCPDEPGFTCSTLSVPLDRSGGHPGALALQVAAANNVDAPRGTLLMITGGPGQPGVPYAVKLSKVLGPLARSYRVVVYDQRGTGGTALRCPALQTAMGGSDLYPPPAAAVRACAARLGPARALYGTDDVVADMDLLRRGLRADRWTLDGISYGTYVAERYALAHPARVKRMVLDSVVPHSAGGDLIPVEMRETARVLRSACADGSCPGDPAADLARVVRARHDGPRLLDALALISIVDPTYRRQVDIPEALHSAATSASGARALDDLLENLHRWEAATAEQLSQGLHASALCGDWRFPWGSAAAPLAGRSRALARFGARLSKAEVWPFDVQTAVGNGVERQCLPWAPTPPTPAPPKKLPAVPTLLLAGDHDLSTPLAWAKREAALAPRGRLVVVHGAGHSVQSRATSDTGRRAVRQFLGG